MKLTLKYFASLREALGAGGPLEWTPEAEPTAAALRAWLRAQSPAHAQALADESTPLREGAEVAFFPPVTGG